MKKLLILFVFLGILFHAHSQTSECLNDFDYLVRKIKADYPGYADKVKGESAQSLHQLEQDLRKRMAEHPDSCGKYLSTYADWFRDHHLRIRRLSSGPSPSALPKPEIVFPADSVSSSLLQSSQQDPLQGIWTSFGGDIAIYKSADLPEYKAVSITFRGYEKNQLVFKLANRAGNEFTMISYPYYDDFIPSKGKASLCFDDRILELQEDTWFVRKSASDISDKALLYSYLPSHPNGANVYPLALALSDSTFYLRIPSFASGYAEELPLKHWKEISCRPNLIIDIRNNGGGQDTYFQTLARLIYDKPYQSKGVEWYATEGNIRTFEQALKNGDIQGGDEGIAWTKAILEEMRKHKGGFVIHPLMGSDQTITSDTVYKNPSKVGIIINEGNASSAEQFLLAARMSSKTTLFGNAHTAGVLDYSNAISEDLPSKRYSLTFPMSRSRRLPDDPLDNIGIAPDVMIPYPAADQLYDRLDSWIYFVKNYLELKSQP